MKIKDNIANEPAEDIRQSTVNNDSTENRLKYTSKKYQCPLCEGKELIMRYEAGYVYSYVIDNDAPGLMNSDEFLSYLYDKRELKEARTYIECSKCGSQFPPEALIGGFISEKDKTKERAFH